MMGQRIEVWQEEAKEEGFKEGYVIGYEIGLQMALQQQEINEIRENIMKIARSLTDILDDKTIAEKTGLSLEEVGKLRSDV